MKKNNLILILAILIFCFFVCCQKDNREKAKEEAWNTVKKINRHWAITENMDSLGLYMHPEMIVIFPGRNERIEGKNRIIESYRSYVDYAQTISLKELNPLVQLYNDNKTAVVTYYYDLEIKIPSGEIQRFTGRDMYTLIKENDTWLAVSQHYSPTPE